MPSSLKVVLSLILVAVLAGWLISRPPPASPSPKINQAPPVEPPRGTLAPLGSAPDWKKLEAYQHTIRRQDFESLMTEIFTTGDAWRSFITLTDEAALITTDPGQPDPVFRLAFAQPGKQATPPRHWTPGDQLPPAPEDKPLSSLRIAIDPGHIGGAWAQMEGRWFSVDGGPPVCEGDLTLKVAQLLKPRLEGLGASVSLVRSTNEPLTPLRPADLLSEAPSDGDPRKLAERLFYRTAEIRARAELVNLTLKPDLVLCLHFNAEPWGNASAPTLVERSHFHLLLNGGYTDEEVALEDQRFELLRKLLQRTHEEETRIGIDVAAAFYSATGLPPYGYKPEARNARTVAGNPFLWARNLLANRLYDCPVIFLEPYVMNSRTDYARIQAGDFDGLREIEGRPRPSILREYADAIATGLANHYRKIRPRR